jgi:hypothetical protein
MTRMRAVIVTAVAPLALGRVHELVNDEAGQ